MKQIIQQVFSRALASMGITDVVPQISVPENPLHGDYSTNIAIILSPKYPNLPNLPNLLKNAIIKDQTISNAGIIERVEVAGPGFINIYLSEASLINQVSEVLKTKDAYGFAPKTTKIVDHRSLIGENKAKKTGQKQGKKMGGKLPVSLTSLNPPTALNFPRTSAAVAYSSRQNGTDQKVLSQEFIPESSKKRVMVEFAHPNTHKAFHIGHLRNITTGESIVRLLESQGHEVVRANYQGDVGMHIAKALYALLELSPYKDQVRGITGIHERVEFLGKAYTAGSKAFEESDEVKKTIGEINKKIYDRDPSIYSLYRQTRQWSLDYFDSIYKRVSTHFDRLYFESEVYESGKKNVLEGLKNGIFEESDGAIIFPGEKYDLHTRVFITKEGNTTYEGKDMGLAPLQQAEYRPDFIVHVLGPEQFNYTRVMFQALDLLFPEDAGKQYHLVYGWVRLKKGKMSSRLGNVVLGEWLLDEAKKSIYKILDKNISSSPLSPRAPLAPLAPLAPRYSSSEKDDIAEKAAIAAVKYSFLRVGISSDIAFDIEASVSLEGDSGPYLQYTYARCKSVLRKSSSHPAPLVPVAPLPSLAPEERTLARSISQFPDVVAEAAQNFSPNTICTYLFHLAQQFNLFYAKHQILPSAPPNSPNTPNSQSSLIRLSLTADTAQVIKNGLYLLGISTMEKM